MSLKNNEEVLAKRLHDFWKSSFWPDLLGWLSAFSVVRNWLMGEFLRIIWTPGVLDISLSDSVHFCYSKIKLFKLNVCKRSKNACLKCPYRFKRFSALPGVKCIGVWEICLIFGRKRTASQVQWNNRMRKSVNPFWDRNSHEKFNQLCAPLFLQRHPLTQCFMWTRAWSLSFCILIRPHWAAVVDKRACAKISKARAPTT